MAKGTPCATCNLPEECHNIGFPVTWDHQFTPATSQVLPPEEVAPAKPQEAPRLIPRYKGQTERGNTIFDEHGKPVAVTDTYKMGE